MTAARTPTARFVAESPSRLLVYGLTGLLASFNQAGVLNSADVHTALAVCRIGSEPDERVALAVALLVRALRNGSVCVSPLTVHLTVFDDAESAIDTSDLPWPEPAAWAAACTASPLVRIGADGPADRPLRLVGELLYLERYWQQQESVRLELRRRFDLAPPTVDLAQLTATLDRLFGDDGVGSSADQQRLAAAVAALSWVTVIAGGPGTGKTTTIARLIALLRDQPGPLPQVALAAPTGKAAARLQEAVATAAAGLGAADQAMLAGLEASTLHRLLGWLPSNRSRFRHDAENPLPHDIVIVDEMSMVSLTLMARLVEAVRPTARLILVGDPDQLSSVDAGAVLADVAAAPGRPNVPMTTALRATRTLDAETEAPVHGVVGLTRTWRFGGGIAELARAIRQADADRAVAVLRGGGDDLVFTEIDAASALAESPLGFAAPADIDASRLGGLVQVVRETARAVRRAALADDRPAALRALDEHRLLCAHSRGPYGVQTWGLRVERWLEAGITGYGEDGEWYVGRPLLVTANDYDLGLYNGDTGVIVRTPDGPRAAFARGGTTMQFAPVRLDTVQTVHAMTVHRAQGSQFGEVAFVLPPTDSPLLTRELLYTAVTRARHRVQVIGTADAVARAVERPANRASGLRDRLADGSR